MTTDRPLSSHDVHNALNPALDDIEVLVQMADEIELGITPAALRVSVLVSVVLEKVGDLRETLDQVCDVKRRDVP